MKYPGHIPPKPIPAAREATSGILELSLDVDSSELHSMIARVEKVLSHRPEMNGEVFQFLFGDGERLQPGLVEFRSVSAGRTGRLSVSLHLSDRLREFLSALEAGNGHMECV